MDKFKSCCRVCPTTRRARISQSTENISEELMQENEQLKQSSSAKLVDAHTLELFELGVSMEKLNREDPVTERCQGLAAFSPRRQKHTRPFSTLHVCPVLRFGAFRLDRDIVCVCGWWVGCVGEEGGGRREEGGGRREEGGGRREEGGGGGGGRSRCEKNSCLSTCPSDLVVCLHVPLRQGKVHSLVVLCLHGSSYCQNKGRCGFS